MGFIRAVPRLVPLAALLSLLAACQAPPSTFDVVIRGGEVIDGTGSPGRRADVGIKGDRITAIGDLAAAPAGQVIDAAGLVVAPGFIDVQGQSGTTLLADGNGESHLRQGVTSEIIGEGGSPAFWTAETADNDALAPFGATFDWSGFSGYFERLRERGIAINLGTFVPATMVRRAVIGQDNRPPTADELRAMEAMVDQAMRDGAFGLSSALIYVPGSFAKTDELVALARVAARYKGIYISHIRGESFNLLNAVDEAVGIGRTAGLPVVIYHLKVGAKANWGRMGEVLAKLDAAGGNVSATIYPYTAGGTSLAASLPLWVQEGGREKMLQRLADPGQRARARREIETTIDGWENLILAATFEGIQIASVPRDFDQSVLGKRIADIARERKRDPWDVYFELLMQSGGRVSALYHMMSEDDMKTAMRWGHTTIGTDSSALRAEGILGKGSPHPRAYGTFPRVLGKYARDEGVVPLPIAVSMMTSRAAQQMGIHDRGRLTTSAFADIVVFNPATVADTATYERPHQYPTGINYVLVNGTLVLDPKGLTGARPGRPLYGPARTP